MLHAAKRIKQARIYYELNFNITCECADCKETKLIYSIQIYDGDNNDDIHTNN